VAGNYRTYQLLCPLPWIEFIEIDESFGSRREAVSSLWIEFSSSSRSCVSTSEKQRRIIVSFYLKLHPGVQVAQINFIQFLQIASIWFFASLFLAVLLPNIGSIIRIIGSLAALFLFFFPGMCLLRISSLQQSSALIVLGCTFLLVGSFIFGVVLCQGITFLTVPSKTVEIPLCTP